MSNISILHYSLFLLLKSKMKGNLLRNFGYSSGHNQGAVANHKEDFVKAMNNLKSNVEHSNTLNKDYLEQFISSVNFMGI